MYDKVYRHTGQFIDWELTLIGDLVQGEKVDVENFWWHDVAYDDVHYDVNDDMMTLIMTCMMASCFLFHLPFYTRVRL